MTIKNEIEKFNILLWKLRMKEILMKDNCVDTIKRNSM